MEGAMSNDTLNKIANIVFIFTCVILVGLAAYREVDRPGGTPNGPSVARQDVVSKGMKFSGIDGVSSSNSNVTAA